MTQEKEAPSRSLQSPSAAEDYSDHGHTDREETGVVSFFKNLMKPKHDGSSLRETIEEYIEDSSESSVQESVSAHEKALISNVLKVRDMTAADVMVPRADIIAVHEINTQEELLLLLAEKQYSRLPVYKDTLDNVIGSIHAKDILATLARGEPVNLPDLVREVPIISPAMPVLDLLLQMRMTRKHMALVIDEFGGIDGLITIGDIIEAIIGEIYDEHAPDTEAEIIEKSDGSFIADARVDIEEFEEIFGKILSEEERNGNDTLGGLVIFLAGRVPARGESIKHSSKIIFEILEADPRRINRVLIKNVPKG